MSMDVKSYIRIAPGFQKSVNLAYDLNNMGKIEDYIPSTSALEIIEPIILSTHPSSTDRAHILIGPYGKGKSHIVLMLLAMMRERENLPIFERIWEAIEEYNPDLYSYVYEYMHSSERLLPVIIQGSSTSLNQSFLYAIQLALKDAGLEDLMPDTHFVAANNKLQMWEKNFPETYARFVEAIAPMPIEEFQARLSEFDASAYEMFVEIYPRLTSGGEFNPFLGFDVVELYSTIASALKDRGYQGLFVVYDEFSKYLEANIRGTSISDIKMLQDFAEKCNRSKADQMHLLLIAHKDIENYIDRLPKNKVDGWRGVSERFTHLEMHTNYGQLYEIMATAIGKTEAFRGEYCTTHGEYFSWASKFVESEALFNDLAPELRDYVVYGGYPLHPTTVFLLPRLSELVAQNERTLFTFISAHNRHTLVDNLDHGTQNVLTPDAIYDYFEPLLKKEVYTSEIFKMYALSNRILAKLDRKSLEAKIVKTLALIYIVNQFEKFPPLADKVIASFAGVFSESDVSTALKKLEEREYVIYAKKSNNYLRLKEANENVREAIESEIKRQTMIGSVKDILEEYTSDTYLYPTRYNDENTIIRYFDFRFIQGSHLMEVKDWTLRMGDSQADGVVYAILPDSEEQIPELRDYLGQNTTDARRTVFVLPLKYEDIASSAYAYNALVKLINEAAGDEALLAEYHIYYEDMGEVLDSFIMTFTRPELRQAEYYHCGNKVAIYRKAQLSQKLSEICETVFNRTPRINNETLNKNDLPTNTINSRTKVVRGLLQTELSPMLGLVGTGQDVSIMRSALIVPGVVDDIKSSPSIHISDCPDERLANVLQYIDQFFANSGLDQSGSNFSALYDELTRPELGIGMKRGPIPLYVAAVLHSYKDHLTISSYGQELEINAELLNSINAKPEAYMAKLLDWSQEKADYIKNLESLFSQHIIAREKNVNSFLYIVRAMQRWYIALPKYAKEARELYVGGEQFQAIEKHNIRFANALKVPSLNPHEFLFESLPKVFGFDGFTVETSACIERAKELYDKALDNLTDGLAKDVSAIFAPNSVEGQTASSAASSWYEKLAQKTKEHVFDGVEAVLLSQFSEAGNDDTSFIVRLAKPATGLRIEDWNSETVNVFRKTVTDLKAHVTEFNDMDASLDKGSSNTYILTSVGPNGETQVRTFDRIEYSRMAKLLKHEITANLDEMGMAISDSEKRQVLIEVLESLC